MGFKLRHRAGAPPALSLCAGKIGTAGQTDTKIHANETVAQKFAAKIRGEKERKGYA